MPYRRTTYLSYLLILVVQAPLIAGAMAWYPGLVARLLESGMQQSATTGDPAVSVIFLFALFLSPALLLWAPYPIARAFWQRVASWSEASETAARPVSAG